MALLATIGRALRFTGKLYGEALREKNLKLSQGLICLLLAAVFPSITVGYGRAINEASRRTSNSIRVHGSIWTYLFKRELGQFLFWTSSKAILRASQTS